MARVEILSGYGAVPAAEWDALVGDDSPFLEHAFLHGLETYACAVPETGWTPCPVIVRDDDGALVAAAPSWIKSHSMGEFVYDHAWADAARRARLPYYPKLIVGVPFTPVTGGRLLVRPGLDRDLYLGPLLAGLQAALEPCHGLHILFNPESEAEWLLERGAFCRTQYQFHWHNHGYADFADFLGRFRSKQRNKIKRERREANQLRIEAATNPGPELLDAMHRFYSSTCSQFGPWGRVYLSRPFLQYLGRTWGHRLHLVTAWDGDRVVAGAFNVLKGDRLYGRYWGCDAQYRFLHFEVCYYRAIEDSIARGLAAFEPGHGGGHKYRRGFVPQITRSSHWLSDPRLHEALRRHTDHERSWVDEQTEALHAHSPLRG